MTEDTAKISAAHRTTAPRRTQDGGRRVIPVGLPDGAGENVGTPHTAAALQYVLAYAVALPIFVLHGAVRRMRMRLTSDARRA